jgi:hypothetical protein
MVDSGRRPGQVRLSQADGAAKTGLSRTGPGQAGYVQLRLTAHPASCGLVLLETGGFDAVPQQSFYWSGHRLVGLARRSKRP